MLPRVEVTYNKQMRACSADAVKSASSAGSHPATINTNKLTAAQPT